MDAKAEAAPAMAVYRIGEWTFVPADDALVRNGERRALEHRAARTLEALCRRRGETVSRHDLIAAVWEGRTLSDNTVAVVISALRKALDDDHRKPRFIETVAKRGYQLRDDDQQVARPANPEPRPRTLFLALSLVLLIAIGSATALFDVGEERTIITIRPIENETGEPRYEPVAAAVDGFAAAALADAPSPVLIREFSDAKSWDVSKRIFRQFGPRTRVYHLSGTIVLDGASPFVSLIAADGRDWSTVWTASVPIESGVVAAPVEAALAELVAILNGAPPKGD